MTKNPILTAMTWVQVRLATGGSRDRGDVVGWALIAVMTLLVVGAIWAFLGEELESTLRDALDRAQGSYNG